jgi:hypothetical protein
MLNAEKNSSFCSSSEFMAPESPQDLEAARYKHKTVRNVATAQSWGVVGTHKCAAPLEGGGEPSRTLDACIC